MAAGILFLDDATDFKMDPLKSGTHDEEKLWDYWREEPLLHVFHSLFHRLHQNTYPTHTKFQRFYHGHQQLIARAAIERRLVGLPELGI